MLRITLAVIAASIVAHYAHSWLIALIVGALVWGYRPKAQTRRVIVENLETGRIRIMSNDDPRTQRFLNSVMRDEDKE